MSIDLLGAQGGRSGGLGGRVTGSFATLPASLYIYVGGAGSQGSGALGGYNGGGTAGSGRGDEGSGGGATDIRTGTTLADRIAVAGGGGGSGGFAGGVGGGAGGVLGSTGTSGQGQGGAGGSASAGGSGGFPNGGSWGSNGGLGQGGTGGSSTTSGGGGGGGGFYGGGGGGADIDSCCTNAGGGGGGSSWINTTTLLATTNTAAYRSGAGLAIISYVMPPSVTTFAPSVTLTNADTINYSLIFNETISGLANTDFAITDSTATCTTIAVTGSLASYTVSVSGCTPGTLNLKLNANSVTGVIVGPAALASASSVTIDRTAPTVVITPPTSPTNAANLNYTISFSESVTGLAASDLTVAPAGCVAAEPIGTGSSYTVSVSSCADGASVVLSLAANAVADVAGNAGPTTATSANAVAIKRTAPAAVFATQASSSYVSPSFNLSFAEPVSGVTLSDFTTSAAGCTLSLTETTAGRAFTVTTSSCALGAIQVSLAANSYVDSLGNIGPLTAVDSGSVTLAAVPAPAPAPAPAPTPTPTPAPAPTQVAAPVAVAPPSAPTPVTTPAAPAAVPVAPQAPAPVSESTPEPVPEPSAISVPEPSQSVVIEQIPAAPKTARPTKVASKKFVTSSTSKASGSAASEVIQIVEAHPEAIAEDSLLDPLQPQGFANASKEIVLQNPTDAKPFALAESQDWKLWATSGVMALAVALAGVGVFRGSKNLRERRLQKKYA